MTDLTSLIERLEKAEWPDGQLDAEILEATGGCAHRETEYYCVEDGNSVDSGFTCKRCHKDTYGQRVEPYTSSIDAAVALAERVLPGWGWSVESKTHHIMACLNPELGEPVGKHPHWAAISNLSSRTFEDAATPAIALLLAILRALRSKGET